MPREAPPTPATRASNVSRGVLHSARAAQSARRPARRVIAPRVVLLTAPATASSLAPAYIAGGDFNRRLRSSRLTPRSPRLPGGQRYLAANLHFTPFWQENLAAKVHAVAVRFLGGFDPVCKDAELELSHSRLQQIADGYTPGDLERLLREHHCR